MRLAILSDVHGNLRALRAVLADLPRQGADLVLNLGDTVSGPLQAAETAELLMAQGFPTIRGNHDRWLVAPPEGGMGLSDRAAHGRLAARHLDWLAALPPLLRPVEGVLACHGTPGCDNTALLETPWPGDGMPDRPARPAPDRPGRSATHQPGRSAPGILARATPAEVSARLGGATAADRLILCGHSHQPGLFHLPDGRLVVNPGSIGQPGYLSDDPFPHTSSPGSPHARYAVLDRTAHGWTARFVALDYDWDAAAAEARQAGREDWARALATGQG